LTAVDPLSQALLADPSRWVRECAACALCEIGSTCAIDALITGLHDTDMSVRESAVRSLGAIAGIEAGDALYQIALNDSGPWVRASATTLCKSFLK
jgi:HEAT repeat protein